MTQLRTLLSRFQRNSTGNVAIIFAFAIVPLIAMVGGGVDYMRFVSVQNDIQGAVDSGLFAAGQLTGEAEIEATLEEYITHNLKRSGLNYQKLQLTYDIELSAYKGHINVEANYALKPYFLSIIGINTINVKVDSGIEQQNLLPLEISLVIGKLLDLHVDSKKYHRNENRKVFQRTMLDLIRQLMPSQKGGKVSINMIPVADEFMVPRNFERFADYTQLYFNPGIPGLMRTQKLNLRANGAEDNVENVDWFKPTHPAHFPPKFTGCLVLDDVDISFDNFRERGHQIFPCLPDDTEHGITRSAYEWSFNNKTIRTYREGIYLSNNRKDLETALSETMFNKTGQSETEALIMGLKALSPALRGTLEGDLEGQRPADFGDAVKVLILMSDGYRSFATAQRHESYKTIQGRVGRLSVFDQVCRLAEEKGILFYILVPDWGEKMGFLKGMDHCGTMIELGATTADYGPIMKDLKTGIDQLRIIK